MITKKLRKHLIIMAFAVIAMFAFCYALVPLYNVFCQVTGLNGKTTDKPQPLIRTVDQNRNVTIELLSMTNQNTAAEFEPGDKKFTLHPGEYVQTHFRVKNLTSRPMVVQAIPSVSPNIAANYIKKVECFCFQKQYLAANEEAELTLKFTIDPAMSHKINQLSLAYTLFDITDKEEKNERG
ncbi:MAG: cytochrome c oxidase assembly protein [Candidatus Berkiella sp.]